MGMVAREGRQPASGFTPAPWYSLAVSTWQDRGQARAGQHVQKCRWEGSSSSDSLKWGY